ncbi:MULTISPECIES: hypothetical protein [Burkholderia]|uniref:Uncharacterized protein n=1 Tax=Burkholderia glumae TaxID=337 RepID=A0AAQ0BR02_BURGL|nr:MULTISPECIES: hypothetical protein [Burkholderia]AJY63741.1 hypothetical protein KS03_3683 [Burkholderia glumae LMG 2196 = ATCC 33617]MCM2484258.1 hypothetical protein [Burkholderia glumae]MCM2494653.1 hypothetical protein [Burkholderia glumae]MCM2509949.1 hypothetical protein [Burkholderia glumae]MCM2539711.1 hypothetical protein [Burkholderia glumae]
MNDAAKRWPEPDDQDPAKSRGGTIPAEPRPVDDRHLPDLPDPSEVGEDG